MDKMSNNDRRGVPGKAKHKRKGRGRLNHVKVKGKAAVADTRTLLEKLKSTDVGQGSRRENVQWKQTAWEKWSGYEFASMFMELPLGTRSGDSRDSFLAQVERLRVAVAEGESQRNLLVQIDLLREAASIVAELQPNSLMQEEHHRVATSNFHSIVPENADTQAAKEELLGEHDDSSSGSCGVDQVSHAFEMSRRLDKYCSDLEYAMKLEIKYWEISEEFSKDERRLNHLESEIERKEKNMSNATVSAQQTIASSLNRVRKEAKQRSANLTILKPQKDDIQEKRDAAQREWKLSMSSLKGQSGIRRPISLTLRHYHSQYVIPLDDFDTRLFELFPNIDVNKAAIILSRYGPLADGFSIVDENGQPRQLGEQFMDANACGEVVVDFIPKNVHDSPLKVLRTEVWSLLESIDPDIVGMGTSLSREDETGSLVILVRDGSTRLEGVQEKVQSIFGSCLLYRSDLFSIPFKYEFMPIFELC